MMDVIDYQRLRDAVKSKCDELHLRKCKLSEQTGIPKSVLTKLLENGDKPNADTFFKLCAWLDQSPHEFTNSTRDKVRVTSIANLPSMLAVIMSDEHVVDMSVKLQLTRWLEWNYEFLTESQTKRVNSL